MATETTIFDFKISRPFDQWATTFDSDENKLMLKKLGIIPLYRGINQEDSSRAIAIFQAEKGVVLEMWTNPDAKKLIKFSGHIFNEMSITSWGWGTKYPS